MGDAVRSIHGQNALDTFAWVHDFIHEELLDAVVTLISGQALHLDDDLEIHTLTLPDDRVKLTLLRPGGSFTVDIDLRALRHPVSHGDARSSVPVPDQWRRTSTVLGTPVWELFNCTVHNVQPHRNAP
ncbi:hypothetical protein GY21_01415 [Cryobacterium roopkundense]|uniref:Uncharacterized protein n=1 Tax=Cryobacterium roopkundense TaxID=1001240 RepID=A0A099JWI3_9MICO|nr:hypothetical protein [Cryobacterium roopkundense]KGJ81763.1 hypothetical protein GY21_01415 [Cryobacterium roopkundense]MBB5642429.1 hypothetical protein [Cryobacterium roopkundense]